MIAAVLDHLWQSTLLAAGIGCLAVVFRKAPAAVRYGLWLTASVKFLVPFAALAVLGRLLAPAIRPPAEAPPDAVIIAQAVQPFSPPDLTAAAAPARAAIASHAGALPDLTLALVGVWALGVAVVLIVWMIRWARIRPLLRLATPLALAAPMPVLATPTMLEPGLVGLRRPVLLVPQILFEHLDRPAIEALVAHEACHYRRGDNLTAALHMLVEALFWFHPMVWWIGGRLVDERERACDEAVVRAGHDPAVYAESLLECCRLFLQSPLRCVAGASGSNLSSRVERIMITPSRSSLSRSGRAMLVGAGVCALASPVAAGWLTSPAESQGAPRALALASSPARALVRESRAAAFAEDETDATKAIAPVRRSAAPAAPLQRIAALRLEPIRLDTGAEDPLAPQLAPAPGRGDDGGDPGCAAGGLGGHPVAAGGLGSRPRTTLAEMQAGQGAAAQPLLDPSVSGAERLGQIAPSNEPAAVRRRPMKAHPAQSGRPALAHVREARRPSRNLNTQGEAVMICGVLDHLRPSASAAAPRSCRGGALMRPGLACVGVLLAAALSPGAVLAQYQMPSPAPMTSPPNTPVGPPGYTPYNPPANLTYGDSSPFTNAGPEGQGCLRARALSGVVASNPREVILRFGGNAFYRVRLAKDCPALVKPGANVAGVSRSTGGVICGSYDVVLKVVAGDGSVSRCGAATLSKMSAAEVKAASAPPQR